MLKTFKKVVEFLSPAKDGEVASKLIFFPDPAEVIAECRLLSNALWNSYLRCIYSRLQPRHSRQLETVLKRSTSMALIVHRDFQAKMVLAKSVSWKST